MAGKNFMDSFSEWMRQNWKKLLGIFLIAGGGFLILFSSRIIFDIIFLIGGCALIYFGSGMLNLTAITKFIDKIIKKFIRR